MVTIGIPVYNCPKHLILQCLDSVINQTTNNIEILIINDCCTDDTMKYVSDRFLDYSNDKNIRIVNHEKNTGIGGARNTIINEAKGEYIYFLDCDDYIAPDAIELLLKKAEENDADAVWGSVMLHTISEQKDSIYNQCPDKLFICKDELATYAFADSHVHLLNAVWNILIKKDFIKKNNLHFETECGFCDDYVFTHTMIPLVTKAVLISNITYYWIIRDGSQSNKTETTISSKPFRNAIIANNLLKDYCLSLKQKPYYEGYCLRIQKESFFNAHAMIKLRKRLDKPISNKEIKDSISPIESLRNIIRFKKLKREHLIFFFLGKMPFYILPISFKVLFRFRNSR